MVAAESSVVDPDPPDPHVFGPPGSGSTSQSYGYISGSGSFYHHAKIVRKIGSESGSGSIIQMHGSADPDPPQNVMDPQHWRKGGVKTTETKIHCPRC